MNVSLILSTFNSIVLSYKSMSFEFLYHTWPENQSASLAYSRVRPPWWQHWQNINISGGFEGLKVLPPLGVWVIEAVCVCVCVCACVRACVCVHSTKVTSLSRL